MSRTPLIAPSPPRWQKFLAGTVEAAIYVFMIVMPLLGWLILSGEMQPVRFFGVELPALIGGNDALAKQLEEFHETMGTIGYFLIGLHAAAALAHHYLFRDNTLIRMLPRRSRAMAENR
jgi:superoxide oxidase